MKECCARVTTNISWRVAVDDEIMARINVDDPQARKRYDDFLAATPTATFYQDRGWAEVKNNWTAAYFLYERDGEVCGAASALSVNASNGHPFIYVSRGPVIASGDVDAWQAIMEDLRVYARAIGAFMVRFDPEWPEDALDPSLYTAADIVLRDRSLTLHSFTQPRCNAILDLKGKTAEAVLMGFSASKRRDTRQGLKHEFVLRKGRDDLFLHTFATLTDDMADRKGINTRDENYFRRLLAAYPDAFIALLDYQGEPITGALMLPYGKKITYLYAALASGHNDLQAPNALIWHLVEDALAAGYEAFDLGGVFAFDRSCGLFVYKSGFVKQEGITCFVGEYDLVIDEAIYKAHMAAQKK